MYADTDFFIALFKGSDWLKEPALGLLKKYQGNISASWATVCELLLLCDRLGMDPKKTMVCLHEIADVEGVSRHVTIGASHIMKQYNVNAMDALHACLCGGKIISSDKVFDKLGISRVKLDHTNPIYDATTRS